MRSLVIAALAAVAVACNGEVVTPDGGAEGGGAGGGGGFFEEDAGTVADAGFDAGAEEDAGTPDAGAADAGGADAGIADAGIVDAGHPDAGPTDAGTPDAGPSTDGGFYGAVQCPNTSYLVCDDFEGATLDPQWSPMLSSGTVTIDSTRAARGAHSLHAVTTPSGGDALISLKSPIPLDGQRLWGRMFVYVPSSSQSMLTNHINLVTASGKNDLNAQAVYAVMIGGGVIGSLFWQDSPGIDTSGLGLQTHVPTNRWFCLEWDFNGVARELNTYVDGQLVPMSKLSGFHPPINATVSVGIQFALQEAWFDSVAFSRTRIGCGG